MAQSTITMLNALNVHKGNSTVKVRIIRLWKQPVITNPNETYSKEMVLIDEEGNKMLANVLQNKMLANVLQKYLHLFDDLLVESDCFFIKNLSVAQDFAKYKYVDNPLKASFTPRTKFTRCSEFSGAFYGFDFTSFDLLNRNLLPESKTIDEIGYIDTYFQVKDIVKKDLTNSKRMNLVLKDGESRRINITLWDSYAEQMSNYLLSHTAENNVVVILQFGIFKFWNGRPGVSNSYHITKLFINEDICDINLFKKNLLDTNGNDASAGRSRVPSLILSLDDDFVNNTQFKHIAEVHEIKKEMSVIVFATVLPISKYTKWYYDSCKICNSQLNEVVADVDDENDDKKVYHCKKCKKEMLEAGKRYRIHINVQDPTGVADLLLWDREANKIFKKTAETLYEEIINGDSDLFPKELKNLEDQKYAFKIDITTYNITRNNKLYSISKSTQDPKIVTQLQKNLNVDQDMDDITADKSTHVTHQEGSPDNKNTKLKRDITEIYPDDIAPCDTAPKTRAKTKVIDKPQGKDTLLTPKQEK